MGSLSKPGNERTRQLSLEWWSISFQKTLLGAKILRSYTFGTSREKSWVSCWWEAELQPHQNAHLGTCSKLLTQSSWPPHSPAEQESGSKPILPPGSGGRALWCAVGGMWRLTPPREKRGPSLDWRASGGGRLSQDCTELWPRGLEWEEKNLWLCGCALSAATAPASSGEEPLLKHRQRSRHCKSKHILIYIFKRRFYTPQSGHFTFLLKMPSQLCTAFRINSRLFSTAQCKCKTPHFPSRPGLQLSLSSFLSLTSLQPQEPLPVPRVPQALSFLRGLHMLFPLPKKILLFAVSPVLAQLFNPKRSLLPYSFGAPWSFLQWSMESNTYLPAVSVSLSTAYGRGQIYVRVLGM